MNPKARVGVTLAIVGVLLIVMGAGMTIVGHNKVQASAEWDQQFSNVERDCGTTYDMSYDEFIKQLQQATSEEERKRLRQEYRESREVACHTYSAPDANPFRGGRSQFWTGLVVTVVGGVVLYYGRR